MKYILDFDGVILNTEALKKKMAEFGIEESRRDASVFDLMKERDSTFEVSDFLFEDAKQFIGKHAHNCVIVSSFLSVDPHNNNENYETQRLYQQAKIELSGIVQLLGKENVHIVGASKKSALAKLKSEYDTNGEECIFIDDRKVHVEEARELGVHVFWMNRNRNSAVLEKINESTKPSEVMSFTELETRLISWEQ